MATLKPPAAADHPGTKQKAIEEARKVHESITKECAEAGRDAPPYVLSELIGKGSFGRVYKAVSVKSRQLVAVKIISIDEGDSLDPGAADTFGDILKEVNTLKLLGKSGAKNINNVIDTLLVGQTMWIVTEHCAGGSVATLMRPTGGLAEKWIIPILREVAEAIYWVHRQGIIHRDVKCANVLITEVGGVQLCDFGVAGIIETRFDKRKTVTGTLQWMAPELFDTSVSYGVEIDIWAFGSMAYEVATGLPPNATARVNISQFGSYLKDHCPRLEGSQYSSQLKDLVAYCLVQDPARRPRIEQIQKHVYIQNTSQDYPTVSLSKLVNAYKVWEAQGGNRQSLFSAGGAQRPINRLGKDDDNDWKFNTLDEHQFDLNDSDVQIVSDVYGFRMDLPPQPLRSQPRRRRPPNIKGPRAPLEKVFDPDIMSNYGDDARAFYGRPAPPPTTTTTTDLPLRDNSEQPTVRESLIDLDASLDGIEPSGFTDHETIKAGARPLSSNLEDPNRRRTQEWIFPIMAPASAGLDVPSLQSDVADDNDYGQYPTPAHQQQSDPVVDQFIDQTIPAAQSNRTSALSLIDLDAGLPDDVAGIVRPSTAGSDAASTISDLGKTPFDLEPYTLEARSFSRANREPSIYVLDDDFSKFSPRIQDRSPPAPKMAPERPRAAEPIKTPIPSLPVLPQPPSAETMQGFNSPDEIKGELRRLISSLGEHLQFASDVLAVLPVSGERYYTAEEPSL